MACDDPEHQEIQRQIQGLVSQITELASPGSMVMKYFVIVEHLDGDGARNVTLHADPSSMKWDIFGLIKFAEWVENFEPAPRP